MTIREAKTWSPVQRKQAALRDGRTEISKRTVLTFEFLLAILEFLKVNQT